MHIIEFYVELSNKIVKIIEGEKVKLKEYEQDEPQFIILDNGRSDSPWDYDKP